MNKTWKPIVAGIIELVSGMFQVFAFALLVIAGLFGHPGKLEWWLLILAYALVTALSALMGLLAMLGGTFALARKRFVLSIIGAFATCFTSVSIFYLHSNEMVIDSGIAWNQFGLLFIFLGGIAALLIVLSKKEFEYKEQEELGVRIGTEFEDPEGLRAQVKKTKMPIIAGIIDIIAGILQLCSALFIGFMSQLAVRQTQEWEFQLIVYTLILNAFLAIVGGIYTTLRIKWPLAMAGSIAASAFLPIIVVSIVGFVEYGYTFGVGGIYMLPGIAAIVLTVLSRKEFK